MVTRLRADDRRSIPVRARNSSLCPIIQTGSGARPAPCPMGRGDSLPRVKRPEREADHSPPYNVEVKNVWGYTSTPMSS